jgi:2-oxoglutarate ferredoxin oxidoreductase subunit delta
MKVYARTPLNLDRIPMIRGRVFVIPQRCKGCELCVNFCPRGVLLTSEQTNAKGYHIPDIAPGKEGDCVHCQFCTLICPEFAIYTLSADGSPA